MPLVCRDRTRALGKKGLPGLAHLFVLDGSVQIGPCASGTSLASGQFQLSRPEGRFLAVLCGPGRAFGGILVLSRSLLC